MIKSKGLSAHGEIMKMLKEGHGVSHGFANTITIMYRNQASGAASGGDELVEAQYAGAKAALRPLYE